jgi:DNA polymerase family B
MVRRRALAGFDTEDNGKGRVLCLGCVHERGTFWRADRDEFLRDLEALRDRMAPRTLELWATNLEYDLVNLLTVQGLERVTLRFGRSYLLSARWRGIEFRDTLRFISASVAELGELVGLPKLETELFEGGAAQELSPELIRRCLRDAAISRRTAQWIHKTFRQLGAKVRTTLPSTVYGLWENKYLKPQLGRAMPAAPREVRERARLAYYGGRTEPFALGDFERVTVCDAASMFPWAMVAAPFPRVWGPCRRVSEGATLTSTGVYEAQVESQLDLPVLPFRTRDEGTVYPNGKWRAWYTGAELRYFWKLGGRFQLTAGYSFGESIQPFKRYVDYFFRRKAKARGAARAIYKLCLCSLYGKFGQGGQVARVMPVKRFLMMPKRPAGLARFWQGLVLWSEDREPPPWGNNVWAALTTARARLRLHHELLRVRQSGCRPLYCDTDSVMYQGELRYPLKAERAGDFEMRGEYPRALIVGKKEYALETSPGAWTPYCKGVPRLAKLAYLRAGSASYTLPRRIRSAARDGAAPNEWHAVTKTRRVSFKHRESLPDGSLLPMTLSGAGD